MAEYTFQVALQHSSGLPEDQFVNVLYFEVNAPDSIESNADDIAALYQGIQNFYAGDITSLVIKVYPLAGGSPELVKTYAFSGGSGNAPYEVAVCLSYYADDEANSNARRRGRIYIGPFNAVGGARPDSTLRAMVLTHGEGLAQIGTASNTTWKMRSQTNNATYKIERVACDDAWDTQRRRGLAPSLREFRDVQ